MGGLLHHISTHPHAVVIDSLRLLHSKLLDPSQGLPATTQAEAFSDTALLQVTSTTQVLGLVTHVSMTQLS